MNVCGFYAHKQALIKQSSYCYLRWHTALSMCPVKQLETCLFFLLTGSDTQHENVATAGGLMWFMVPGSQLDTMWTSATLCLIQASAPRCVINWEKWTTVAAHSAPLACLWFLLLPLSLTHNTRKQSCFSMFRSRTRLCILPLLAPSCIIFPKPHLSPGDAHFLWAALYK